jgi:ecdysone receptor
MINGIKPVSPEQEELIHRLVYFQNEYEQPSEEDLKRIMVMNTQILFKKNGW